MGELMAGSCLNGLADEVLAAYDAPFPVAESKAAVKGLPMSVPRSDDEKALAAVDTFLDALSRDARPMLMLWGECDLILGVAVGQRLAVRIGHRIDHVIPDAGHGLQEDQGPMVGELIADWLLSSA
jgi:haloalkane dehalogenase